MGRKKILLMGGQCLHFSFYPLTFWTQAKTWRQIKVKYWTQDVINWFLAIKRLSNYKNYQDKAGRKCAKGFYCWTHKHNNTCQNTYNKASIHPVCWGWREHWPSFKSLCNIWQKTSCGCSNAPLLLMSGPTTLAHCLISPTNPKQCQGNHTFSPRNNLNMCATATIHLLSHFSQHKTETKNINL